MTKRILLRDDTPDAKGRPHIHEVYAKVTPDGGVKIGGFFGGDAVEERFGEWDHEFGLTIGAGDLPRAVIAILAVAFAADEPMSYSALRELLIAERLDVSDWTWT